MSIPRYYSIPPSNDNLQLPTIHVDQTVASLIDSQDFTVMDRSQSPESVRSELDESSYDMLSDALTDDDARTESLASGSDIGDEERSDSGVVSEYRYDAEDEDQMETMTVPLVLPTVQVPDASNVKNVPDQAVPCKRKATVTKKTDASMDQMLSSEFSIITEKASDSIHQEQPTAAQQADAIAIDGETLFSLISRTSSNFFNFCVKTYQDLQPETRRRVKFISLLVAVAMATSALVTPLDRTILPNTKGGIPPVVQPVTTSASTAKLKPSASPESLVGGWTAQVREYCGANLWTSTKMAPAKNAAVKSALPSQLIMSNPAHPKPSPISKKPMEPMNIKAPQPLKSNPSVTKSEGTDQRKNMFYLYLDSGILVPVSTGRKRKSSDRIGPLTQLTGPNEKFKVEFFSLMGKFSITSSSPIRGSAAIIVKKGDRRIQRGHLAGPKSRISWIPNKISTEELQGVITVTIVLPAESTFQVVSINVDESGTTAWKNVALRWSGTLSTYVEPLKSELEDLRRKSRVQIARMQSRAEMYANAETMARVQDSAAVLADQVHQVQQAIVSTALQSRDVWGSAIARAADRAVMALRQSSALVAVEAEKCSRKSLAKAQKRVRELQRRLENGRKIRQRGARCDKKRGRKSRLFSLVT